MNYWNSSEQEFPNSLILKCNQSFISVWTQGYLFYPLDYNSVQLYLCCSLRCAGFEHWELFFSWLLYPSLICSHLFVC